MKKKTKQNLIHLINTQHQLTWLLKQLLLNLHLQMLDMGMGTCDWIAPLCLLHESCNPIADLPPRFSFSVIGNNQMQLFKIEKYLIINS